MKPLALVACLIAVCGAAPAELVSPDGQYEIEYFEACPFEGNVKFKNARSGKILGYAISYGYDPGRYLETVWSPDSRYLAVVSRGTRTTAGISVFSFAGDTVEEVRLPDYLLNLLGRRELVEGGRHHWVSGLRWEGTTITFHCKGQWIDGSGDPAVNPENWYHFDVSLRLGGPGSEPQPKLVAVTKVESEPQGGGRQSAIRPESEPE